MLSKMLKKTAVEFEKDREELLTRFNEEMKDFESYEEDNELSKEIEKDFENLECISKLQNLDSITFIQIDFESKGNVLFGEISKAIEDAINIEINEITNINEKTAARHANVDILQDNYTVKKRKIIDDLLEVQSNRYEENLMSIRCMEVYSELAQSVDVISEKTNKKIREHENLLLFIGVLPKVNKDIPEANLTEVVSYTIAIVSNIKDGTIPDIEQYKTKVIESINDSINSIPNSQNVKTTLKNFNEVSDTLNKCKEQLTNIPEAKGFVNTITAIENICSKEAKQIDKLYEADLEL